MASQKTIKVGIRADEIATTLSERFEISKSQVVELALRKIAEDAERNGGICVRPIAKSGKGVAIGQNAGQVKIKQGNR